MIKDEDIPLVRERLQALADVMNVPMERMIDKLMSGGFTFIEAVRLIADQIGVKTIEPGPP